MNRYQYQVHRHQLKKQLRITEAICNTYLLLVIFMICFALITQSLHIHVHDVITQYQQKQAEKQIIQAEQDELIPVVSSTPDSTSILGVDATR